MAEYDRDGADDIIADCLFEDIGRYDFESELMTDDEAERFIKNYISEN